ncbi:hypothetical protein [Bifidobacterium vespertilionis]|nr:hypothetical protein [Bifidobacterium vespertilionis]MBT1178992.1 hypothetical protein [Bifidobacterium vespertilionis]
MRFITKKSMNSQRLVKPHQTDNRKRERTTMNALKRVLLGAFIPLLGMACLATPAFAGNALSTSWSGYAKNWSTFDTPNRQKQNASDSFVRADNVSGNHTLRVWALGYGNDDVGSGVRFLTSNTYANVPNNAFKNGPKQIHLRMQNVENYSSATSAYGVWSPDSN